MQEKAQLLAPIQRQRREPLHAQSRVIRLMENFFHGPLQARHIRKVGLRPNQGRHGLDVASQVAAPLRDIAACRRMKPPMASRQRVEVFFAQQHAQHRIGACQRTLGQGQAMAAVSLQAALPLGLRPGRVLWMSPKRKRLTWDLASSPGFYLHPLQDIARLRAERLSPDAIDGLTRLGLRRVEEVMDLPRAALARRFGTDTLRRIAGDVAELTATFPAYPRG